MSRLISLDPETLSQTLSSHSKGLLVLFSTTWCGPCRTYKPVLERVVAESSDSLCLLTIDADASGALATYYAIRSIPTLLCFARGALIAQRAGSMPEPRLRTMLRDLGLLHHRPPAAP